MNRNEAIAEALSEGAAELDEQRRLLNQILQVCTTTADGLNQHISHAMEQANEYGRKQHDHERRLRRIEELTGGE